MLIDCGMGEAMFDVIKTIGKNFNGNVLRTSDVVEFFLLEQLFFKL